MTEIVRNIEESVIFRDKHYHLIKPSGLFNLKKYGLRIKGNSKNRTTAGLNLYNCTYLVEDARLYLDYFSTENKFTYTGMRSWLRPAIPKINGISANDQVPDPREGELIYGNINLELDYSGELEAGILESGVQTLATKEDDYKAILTLYFSNGRLVKADMQKPEEKIIGFSPDPDMINKSRLPDLSLITADAFGKLYQNTEDKSYWYRRLSESMIQKVFHNKIELLKLWEDQRYLVSPELIEALKDLTSDPTNFTIHMDYMRFDGYVKLKDGQATNCQIRLYKKPPIDLPDLPIYPVADLMSIELPLKPRSGSYVSEIPQPVNETPIVIGRWDNQLNALSI